MSVEPEPQKHAESVPVQLTRIEGIITLMDWKLTDVLARVDRHDVEINELKSTTQHLQEGVISDKATRIALANALKEADESRRNQAAHVWTPFAKTFAAVAAVASFVGILLAFRAGL